MKFLSLIMFNLVTPVSAILYYFILVYLLCSQMARLRRIGQTANLCHQGGVTRVESHENDFQKPIEGL